MAEDRDNTAAEAQGPDHGHDDEIHMPPNSWWPMVTSIGLAITMVGIIFLNFPFIIGIGVVVLLAGVVMWVVDARKEYGELH